MIDDIGAAADVGIGQPLVDRAAVAPVFSKKSRVSPTQQVLAVTTRVCAIGLRPV
jgi:hypothetical protein